jgi:hypothetical protein
MEIWQRTRSSIRAQWAIPLVLESVAVKMCRNLRVGEKSPMFDRTLSRRGTRSIATLNFFIAPLYQGRGPKVGEGDIGSVAIVNASLRHNTGSGPRLC